MKKNKWLNAHLNTFVKPVLGSVPAPNLSVFTGESLKILVKCWKAAKKNAKNKTILLAGRDVWEFAILAGLDGTTIEFRPDISMLTLGHVKENYEDYYLIDSGYSGSVPRGLKVKSWNLVSGANQLILGSGCANTAGDLEGAPKYWRRANMYRGEIRQLRARVATFRRAAANTQAIVEICHELL